QTWLSRPSPEHRLDRVAPARWHDTVGDDAVERHRRVHSSSSSPAREAVGTKPLGFTHQVVVDPEDEDPGPPCGADLDIVETGFLGECGDLLGFEGVEVRRYRGKLPVVLHELLFGFRAAARPLDRFDHLYGETDDRAGLALAARRRFSKDDRG